MTPEQRRDKITLILLLCFVVPVVYLALPKWALLIVIAGLALK